METLTKMIDRQNILLIPHTNSQTQATILDIISTQLQKTGFVTAGFKQAIKDREKKFPTGLNTATYGIAIPHTDSDYVKQATIAIALLEEPVVFQEMGAEEIDVKVRLIFMLAIKNADMQLETLQEVVELLADDNKMNRLLQAENVDEILAALS
ncbi:PTS sugar transporter subunit IIA [Vagococcus sp. BWB3-3]|uniref:PTS sugar transporter subunit IIA n=1 Tax=Vagococcus allomyrinae TaxID=2794353 RepID=A0A940P2K2_9ENTE|nr:PTS sugar transporter subunit IIA [Vagococcus allomyrinae]MBP1040279.1 PTS sugar transporter subunit IIA [Vagococcus allomyrinae]